MNVKTDLKAGTIQANFGIVSSVAVAGKSGLSINVAESAAELNQTNVNVSKTFVLIL